MALFNIGNWFGGAKKKEIGLPFQNLVFMSGTWIPMAGNDTNYINKGFSGNDYIYAIVSHIADKASDAPGQLMRVKDEKEAKRYFKMLENGNFKNDAWKISKSKAFESIDNHEITKVINNPNSIDTEKTLKEQFFGYRLITGNGYLYFDTTGIGSDNLVNIWCLPSPTVSIVLGDRVNPIGGYKVGLNVNDNIDPKYIMHSKKLSLTLGNDNNWVYGMSPLKPLCSVIGLTENAVKSMGESFSNQGASGIVSAAGDDGLDEKNTGLLQERFNERVYAKDNKGRVIITSENIKYTQLGFAPADLELIESDEVFMRRIANVYRYPIDLLTGSGTYNNSETGDRRFITTCIIPEIRAFDEAFTKKIREIYKDNSLVWVTDLQYYPELSEDRSKRADYLSKATWLSVDEKRIADDYDPIGGEAGAAILTPMGLSDLKDVIATQEENAENTGDI